jgi:hypothetical protein
MALTHQTDHLGQMLARLPEQYKGKPRMETLVRAFAQEIQSVEDALWLVLTLLQLQRGPAYVVGRATFYGTKTAALAWPYTFSDSNYLTLPGPAVITEGGPTIAVAVDGPSKTTTGATVVASDAFAGYVDVLAWNAGEKPLARGPSGDLLDKLGKIVGEPRNGLGDVEYYVLITARIAANRSDGRRATLIKIAKLLVPGSVYVKDFPPASLLMIPSAPISVNPYTAAQSFLQPSASAGVRLIFGWSTTPGTNRLTAGYSVANGTTIPSTAQSPGWSGGITGGIFSGAI